MRLGRDRSESVNECDNLFSICLVYSYRLIGPYIRMVNYGRMARVPVICWKKKLAHVDQRDAAERGGSWIRK